MDANHRIPSPALVVGLIALVAATAGSAAALPGKGKVETNDLERRAVTTQKLDKQAVRSAKLSANAVTTGKIRDGAVTAAKLADDAVSANKIANGTVGLEKLSGIAKIGLTRLAASAGANEATARDAAPAQELFKKGPLTVYGKCFTDTASDQTHAEAYTATSAAGSIMWGGVDTLEGEPFLDPATPEAQRIIWSEIAPNDTASGGRSVFHAAAPDGTSIEGTVAAYAKNGTLAGSNGIYGDGDVCLFAGDVIG